MTLCALPVLLGFGIPLAFFANLAIRFGDQRATELFIDHGGNTLLVALIAAIAAVTLAVVLAYAQRLHRTLLTHGAARLAGMGYAVPGTVVAVGLLIPLGALDRSINASIASIWGTSAMPGLIFTGSIAAIILGYQARFLAVALGLVDAGLGRIRHSLDDAARTLGASRFRVLRAVHLPLLRKSVLLAMLLVFVDVIKELPATLILRPFNFETLAVRVYQLASDERLDEAATGALAIMLIGLIPTIALTSLVGPRQETTPAGATPL